VTTAVAPHFVVSEDEMQVIGARIGIAEFPAVLGIRPRYGTVDALTEALDRATGALVSRGLIVDGAVSAELTPLLHALRRPDRGLATRLVTPEGTARIALVRRGNSAMMARRVNDEIVLRAIDGSLDLAAITRTLIGEIPRAEAAQISPVGAPLETISQKLLGTHDSAELADRIRTLGAEPRAAMVLGSALSSRMAFAEIVYYALDLEQDRLIRRPAAVGVFYTKRGRIVGAPSVSPSGELWSTLKPGSDHALAQAIKQLVELSQEAWAAD
jgi:hypothetical protein